MTEFAQEMEREGVPFEHDDETGDRIAHRSHPLLPEEERAGSDDPQEQGRVILEDSDERTNSPERGAEESTQVADR